MDSFNVVTYAYMLYVDPFTVVTYVCMLDVDLFTVVTYVCMLYFDFMQVKENATALTLDQLFCQVFSQHRQRKTQYTLSGKADKRFGQFYNYWENEKQKYEDDGAVGFAHKQDYIGIISKSYVSFIYMYI